MGLSREDWVDDEMVTKEWEDSWKSFGLLGGSLSVKHWTAGGQVVQAGAAEKW